MAVVKMIENLRDKFDRINLLHWISQVSSFLEFFLELLVLEFSLKPILLSIFYFLNFLILFQNHNWPIILLFIWFIFVIFLDDALGQTISLIHQICA